MKALPTAPCSSCRRSSSWRHSRCSAILSRHNRSRSAFQETPCSSARAIQVHMGAACILSHGKHASPFHPVLHPLRVLYTLALQPLCHHGKALGNVVSEVQL